MRQLLYRLRGLAGLSLIGMFAGVLFGMGWGLLAHSGVLPRFYQFPLIGQLQVFGMLFGVVGTAAGVGFGLLLTTTSRRLTLERINPKRVALLGGIAGGGAPLLVLFLIMANSLPPLALGVPIVLIGGGLGALAGVGLVNAAKRAGDYPALRPDDTEARRIAEP